MYRPFESFESFQITGNFISVIGSGGKTTFLRALSEHLPGRVILTTSTHIFPFPGIPLVDTAACPDIISGIRRSLEENRVICLGERLPSGKLGDPSRRVPFEALLSEAAYVIVEADGAASHPLKAHRSHEPVIPSCTTMTVCLAGASGIGKSVREACHCPELFASLAGISVDDPVTPEAAARVLNQEDLADCYLVNQADLLENRQIGLRLCDLIRKDAYLCSLKRPE